MCQRPIHGPAACGCVRCFPNGTDGDHSSVRLRPSAELVHRRLRIEVRNTPLAAGAKAPNPGDVALHCAYGGLNGEKCHLFSQIYDGIIGIRRNSCTLARLPNPNFLLPLHALVLPAIVVVTLSSRFCSAGSLIPHPSSPPLGRCLRPQPPQAWVRCSVSETSMTVNLTGRWTGCWTVSPPSGPSGPSATSAAGRWCCTTCRRATWRGVAVAKRFFKHLLHGLKYKPRSLITAGLRSYGFPRRSAKHAASAPLIRADRD